MRKLTPVALATLVRCAFDIDAAPIIVVDFVIVTPDICIVDDEVQGKERHGFCCKVVLR